MSGKYIISGLLAITLILVSSCNISLDKSENSNITPSNSNIPIEKWGWKEIADNFLYTIAHIDKKDLILVKIDPKKYEFEIYENKNKKNAKTIEEVHLIKKPLLTFNGGFFTEDFKPTGLLLTKGKEIRHASNAQLTNGILAIKHNGETDFFYKQNNGKFPITITPKNYTFAIQNGPALINQEGKILITRDTGEKSSRTALGIDKDGNIVLIVLKQSLLNTDNAISLYKFAHMLKNSSELKNLGLHSVLNLDGGASTGMMIDKKYFPEMEKVQNIVIVKPNES